MIRRLAPWLALALLCTATVLVWQGRFSAIPDHPINGDAGFGKGLDKWQKGGGKNGLRLENGRVVARFARPAHNGELISATHWVDTPTDADFLHVRLEAKWTNAADANRRNSAPHVWLMARGGTRRYQSQWQSSLFQAIGSRDWHREEAVYPLGEDLESIGLVARMSGAKGSMELRHLQITAARLRPWIPVAVALLLVGWTSWFCWRIHRGRKPVSRRRAALTAAILVAGCWFLVFPSQHTRYKPLVGSFFISAASVPDTDPAVITPAPPQQQNQAKVPHRPATTAKRKRPQPPLTERLRLLNLSLDLVHIGAFFLLSLAVFLAAGNTAPWRILIVVALLSEVMPAWHEGWADFRDILDLISDLGGIALAAAAFRLIVRRPHPDSHLPSS